MTFRDAPPLCKELHGLNAEVKRGIDGVCDDSLWIGTPPVHVELDINQAYALRDWLIKTLPDNS